MIMNFLTKDYLGFQPSALVLKDNSLNHFWIIPINMNEIHIINK